MLTTDAIPLLWRRMGVMAFEITGKSSVRLTAGSGRHKKIGNDIDDNDFILISYW